MGGGAWSGRRNQFDQRSAGGNLRTLLDANAYYHGVHGRAGRVLHLHRLQHQQGCTFKQAPPPKDSSAAWRGSPSSVKRSGTAHGKARATFFGLWPRPSAGAAYKANAASGVRNGGMAPSTSSPWVGMNDVVVRPAVNNSRHTPDILPTMSREYTL